MAKQAKTRSSNFRFSAFLYYLMLHSKVALSFSLLYTYKKIMLLCCCTCAYLYMLQICIHIFWMNKMNGWIIMSNDLMHIEMHKATSRRCWAALLRRPQSVMRGRVCSNPWAILPSVPFSFTYGLLFQNKEAFHEGPVISIGPGRWKLWFPYLNT